MFFRRERVLPKEKAFLSISAAAFKTRFPQAIIESNAAAADLIRAHPKCQRQMFVWSGEFTIVNERHDPTTYSIAADGPIHVPTTHVIVLEK